MSPVVISEERAFDLYSGKLSGVRAGFNALRSDAVRFPFNRARRNDRGSDAARSEERTNDCDYHRTLRFRLRSRISACGGVPSTAYRGGMTYDEWEATASDSVRRDSAWK